MLPNLGRRRPLIGSSRLRWPRRSLRIGLLALLTFATAAVQATAAWASFPSSPQLDNFAADSSQSPHWITPALGEGSMYLDVAATPHQFTGTSGLFAGALWDSTYANPVEAWTTIARSGTGDASLYVDVTGGTSGSVHPNSAYFADFGGASSQGSRSQVSIWRVDGVDAERRLTFASSPFTQLQPGDQIGMSNNAGVIIAWYRPAGGSWRAVVSITDTRYSSGRIAVEDIPGGDYGFTAFGGGTSAAPVASTHTTTSIASSRTNVNVGQSVTYTATVSPAPRLPGGTIAFLDGGQLIAGCAAQAVDAAGHASCATSYAAFGTHVVDALYTGSPDGAFAGSTNTPPAVVTVVESTVTTLSSSTATPVVGAPVLYTAKVTPAPDGGSVSFTDAGKLIRSCGSKAVRGGLATCRVIYRTSGIHAVRASYRGDAHFKTSTSSRPLRITVSARSGLRVATGRLIVMVSCPAHSAGCRITPTLAIVPAGVKRVFTFHTRSAKLKAGSSGQFAFVLNKRTTAYLRGYARGHRRPRLIVTVRLILADGDGSRGIQTFLTTIAGARTVAQL
ncbi:MAG: Ig-like domain repeat protein [Solirubrobacterales bacterium]|nr:Ig-like domain repeat protein [Solirubrobacterales bacterium]